MHSKIYDNSVNYTATVVEIKQLFPIEKSDNILRAVINHCDTVVSKDTGIGEWGLFFPPETQLSDTFLKNNNLYRDSTLNVDITQKGYFETNGRIRCQVFRGVKSEGFYIPIKSLDFLGIDLTDISAGYEFNEIEGIEICKKYIPKNSRIQGTGNKTQAKRKQIDLICEGQWHFHYDTLKLVSQLHEFKPEDVIVITRKKHGSSHISSNLLVKKELRWFEKVLNYLGVNIKTEEYQNVYSSRKVIKAVGETNLANEGFYDEDIWKAANNIMKPLLINGQTIYCELYGYQPNSSKFIQSGYDYGNSVGSMNLDVYRITTISPEGIVHEWDWESVKQWCNKYDVNHVEEMYYGTAQLFTPLNPGETNEQWQEQFLEDIKTEFLEKDAWDCKNNVPDEGVCIMNLSNRVWRKCKSWKFLQFESSELDKGNEVDLESQESQTE